MSRGPSASLGMTQRGEQIRARENETGAGIAGCAGPSSSGAQIVILGHQSPETACPPSAARAICSGVNQSRSTEPILMNQESCDGASGDGW